MERQDDRIGEKILKGICLLAVYGSYGLGLSSNTLIIIFFIVIGIAVWFSSYLCFRFLSMFGLAPGLGVSINLGVVFYIASCFVCINSKLLDIYVGFTRK